jgi:acetylornithine deacetylase
MAITTWNSIDWLTKLISFDTTSSHSNLPLIEYVNSWLIKHNIKTTLTFDDNKQKANLFAVLPSKNGELSGGVILSGHTDVVPVDGQQWDTDPFLAVIKNDRLYGRGSSDMKGFLAVILALIPEMIELSLNKPLYLAFSYDEEVGCLGAPRIIADFQHQGIMPAACIVGEPTNMKPVIAHKGINAFRCRLYGQATHSSLTPQGCNAIEFAAALIRWIRQLAEDLKSGPLDPHYDVAYTTITTNMISGGAALNIIPSFCEFFFEFRNLPGVDCVAILQQIKSYVDCELLPIMQQVYPAARIEIDAVGSVPAHEVTEDVAITQLVRKMTNEYEVRKVSYATEAGLFQQAGISTLICGPGSIEQAHRANEYIELDQLVKCDIFLKKLIAQFSATLP